LATLGSSCLMPEMIDRVETAPAFTTANSTALLLSMDDIGLRWAAVMHIGYVAHIDDRSIDGLDRQIFESGNIAGRSVQIHRVFERADFLSPHRGDQVLNRQGVDDVVRGNAVGVQRLLFEVGLDLPDLAAIG